MTEKGHLTGATVRPTRVVVTARCSHRASTSHVSMGAHVFGRLLGRRPAHAWCLMVAPIARSTQLRAQPAARWRVRMEGSATTTAVPAYLVLLARTASNSLAIRPSAPRLSATAAVERPATQTQTALIPFATAHNTRRAAAHSLSLSWYVCSPSSSSLLVRLPARSTAAPALIQVARPISSSSRISYKMR